MTRRVSAAVVEARAVCADEFAPLWQCAPFLPVRLGMTLLERADCQAAAKKTAFAWLAAKLKLPGLSSFDDINDLATLREAYRVIWHSTIADVRRWADAERRR